MKEINWSWFYQKIRLSIEPVMQRHGFSLKEMSSGTGIPELSGTHEGVEAIYESAQASVIKVYALVDTYTRAGVPAFYRIGGSIDESKLIRLILPPALPFLRGTEGWECPATEDASSILGGIAKWLDKHLADAHP